MTNSPSRNEIEAIVGPLENHARQLWGPQKASALRAAMESTAASIAKIRKDLPSLPEEPGFYL